MSNNIGMDTTDSAAAPEVMSSDAAVRACHSFRKQSVVKIIVDTTCDFTPGVTDALDVEVIGFPFIMSDGEHIDDQWKSISAKEFYDRMREGEIVTTSAVAPGRYLEVFEAAAKEGKPTICITLTAALSSSNSSANQAADMIREKYPDFKLEVIDPLVASSSGQLLAIETAYQAGMGMSFEDLVDWVKEARYYLSGFFTLENFDALARGGRIPPTAATVGGKLDIKPELTYGLDASLGLKGMCRGRKKALRAILADFRENWCGDPTLPVCIVSADSLKDAEWLADQIRKEPGCRDLAIMFSTVSPVLGAHVGPGMVAATFWSKDRREKMSFTDRIARKVRSGHAE